MGEEGDAVEIPSLFGAGGTSDADQNFWKSHGLVESISAEISEWPNTLSMRPETKERDFHTLCAQVSKYHRPGKYCIYATGCPKNTKVVIVVPHLTKGMQDDHSLTTGGDARKIMDSLTSHGLDLSEIMIIAAIPFFPDTDWGKAQPGRGVAIPEYVLRVFLPYLRCALEILRPHTIIIMNGPAMEIMSSVYKVATMSFQRLALTVKSAPEEEERGRPSTRLGMLEMSSQFRVAPRLTTRLIRLVSPYYILTDAFGSSEAARSLGGLEEALRKQDELIRGAASFVAAPAPSTNAFDRLMRRSRPANGEPTAKRVRLWETAFGGRLTTLAQPSDEATLVTLSTLDGFLVWIDASTHPIVNSKARRGVAYTHLRPIGRPDERWSPASLTGVVASVLSAWSSQKSVALICNDGIRVSAILSAAIMLRVVPFLSVEQAIDLSKKKAWRAWAGKTELEILLNLRVSDGMAWLADFVRPEDADKRGMRRLFGMVVDQECDEVRHIEFGHHPEPLASAFLDAVTPRLAEGRYVYSVDLSGNKRFAKGVTDPSPKGKRVDLTDLHPDVLCDFILNNE